MITNRLLLLQERLDAVVSRRPRRREEPSSAREYALRRHRRDYLESDTELRQRNYDRTQAPSSHLANFRGLRGRLVSAGVPVTDAPIDLEDFDDWRGRHRVLDRYYRSHGDIHIEKCLEHYIVDRALQLQRGHIYIDVASAGSPWARTLRRRGVEAYRLDLIYQPGIRGINIGGDATATGLPAGFARALSIQCAFELFFGETDRQCLAETARILEPGGRAVITPLYLDNSHFVLHSPAALPPPGSEEPDAVRIWRDDDVPAPFSRHYSPETFVARIASCLPRGLSGCVLFSSNLDEAMEAHPGQRIYPFFTYVLEKARA